MKRFAVMVILAFCLASVAKADSFVSVVIAPTTFSNLQAFINGQLVTVDETVGVSFNWDTTTQTLSDFAVTAVGPFGEGLSNIPTAIIFKSSGGLSLLNFSNGQGDQFQMNSGIHGGLIPPIPPVPGVYSADLDFFCPQCVSGGDNFKIGTATVSSTAISEPGTLVLLGVGLAALAARKRRKQLLASKWEPLA
jgi:hypothetical protein